MLKLVGLSAVMALAATTAQAQVATKPLSEGRPCAYADVVGLWKSQVLRSDEPGVENLAAIAPQDYMRFRPNGEMMYFASTRDYPDVAAINARMDVLDRADGDSYRAEIPSSGLLVLWRNGRPFQGFTCTVVAPREGRSVTILSEIEGQPYLRRVQTRLD